MYKIISTFSILVFTSFSLFANTPGYTISLDKYRIQGIANLEREMDIQLTSKEYWNDFLKNHSKQASHHNREGVNQGSKH